MANKGYALIGSDDKIVNLSRAVAGDFDSVDFDSTSYNRGWITITYSLT